MATAGMDPLAARVVADLKDRLTRLYGNRLRGVFLFGSRARGDGQDDSDVDVLVVLEDFGVYGQELERTSEARADVSLSHDVSVSLVFVRERDWRSTSSPFLDNVRREAIAA